MAQETLEQALEVDLERIATTGGEPRRYHFPPNASGISEWSVRAEPKADSGGVVFTAV